MANPKALCLHFSHNWGRTLLIVISSGDGEGVKIGSTILVPKIGTLVPSDGSCLVIGTILGSESELVVRFSDGMGSVYSPSMSSPSKVENMTS